MKNELIFAFYNLSKIITINIFQNYLINNENFVEAFASLFFLDMISNDILLIALKSKKFIEFIKTLLVIL